MKHGDVCHDSSDEDGEKFVETDPTGRYGRYGELLGAGAVKKVYKAFDNRQGTEVAWNQVSLRRFADDDAMMGRLFNEVKLLMALKNDNIISCSHAWNDSKNMTLNFITQICTSGSLRDYRMKHRRVSLRTLKKWAKQILVGLNHLHSQQPRVIHRDLNLSNVFIDGHNGRVRIGDFGLAAVAKSKNEVLRSVVGTPEFMAPEIYEEKYDEKVDVYAFGMCVLEIVTREVPYSECDNVVKIFKKVTSGVKPRALGAVKDLEVKKFIEKCLVAAAARPTAAQLLEDPFFDGISDEDESFVLCLDFSMLMTDDKNCNLKQLMSKNTNGHGAIVDVVLSH
ncbi:putative serine/threonine-protein kinase WNK11 [Morus notabilis]|uniref:non-specific serine/threonine protein kinase n=1 Tax=Morus notabilis TaxID=981085 RepID=W9R510_9ROSA|nr:probable serine/threonine-protein kinase WNK11 [Morus notabilis]EXB56657.1 putative serine/threonine-protein kinase WNK11 [Morus notabilis]